MVLKKIMKIKLSLPIGVLLSLIILYPVISISLKALSDFYIYQKVVDPEMQLNLPRYHYFVKNRVKKEWIKIISPIAQKDEKSALKTFNITIDQDYIHQLNANLPMSGKQKYFNAFLKISTEPGIKKIKLRYRGAGNYHWINDKKSLKIKIQNGVYDMQRQFNLINPVLINSFHDVINYKLSKKLGLISPDSYPVRVKINGRYMGVYLYLSQVDESLLRKHKRMPGSIYDGDLTPQRSYEHLWNDEKSWDKKSSRSSDKKNNRTDIQLFIKSIRNDDAVAFNQFVETYLDKNAFFNFIALDRLFGSHHHDYVHNHKTYFDPYKGKFEPISWDLRFWQSIQQKDLSLYPLQLRLASNPEYDLQIDKRVYRLMKSNSYQNIIDDYQRIIDSVVKDVESDIYRDKAVVRQFISSQAVAEPFMPEELIATLSSDKNRLKARFAYLQELYTKVDLQYAINKMADKDYQLNFVIAGNNPVLLDFSAVMQDKSVQITDSQKSRLQQKITLYPSKKIVANTQHRYDVEYWGDATVQNYPQNYTLRLQWKDNNPTIDSLFSRIRFTNSITGHKVIPKQAPLKNITAVRGRISSLTPVTNVILNGIIHVHKQQSYDANTHVTIMPGTTFIMYPDQSLYFYGKLIAKGTEQQPIKIIAQNPLKPWGVIAIQGQSANGSVLEYCHISNGSIAVKNLIEYTAPLNIHDVHNFSVRYSTIARNHLGDDAMHVAYAQGVIENNIFVDARSDALDIDISKVIVNHNLFYRSGNDALDTMTTELQASNNLFIQSGDKGLSVGEWSHAQINQNYFYQNLIGLEIKDQSEVVATGLIIEESGQKAINLYHKNKRYNKGGWLKAENIVLLGNDKISVDKRSTLVSLQQSNLQQLKNKEWYAKIKTRLAKFELMYE